MKKFKIEWRIVMTHEDFAHICLSIKKGNTDIPIPCCANCKYYTKVSLTDLTYYECNHPLMDTDDPYVGVSLTMAPEDFCSCFEQRKD